jgi:nucleotide-binding universal stress UspA family protein
VIERAGSASLMLVRAGHLASSDLAALQYCRVLAPLDGSARAECILPLAAALARVPDTQIRLVHVVERPAMPRRTPLSREDHELAERLVARNFVEAERYLEVMRTQFPPAAVETQLLIDDHVAGALHALVDQEQIDLVLLSAHGYSGQLQWPYGSLAASFVAYGSSPLLIFQDASSAPASATPRGEGRR